MNNYVLDRPDTEVHFYNDYQSWTGLRKRFIGGSDIGAIMNSSRFATPFTIWCEKLGVSVKKDTPAMKRGREMEDELLAELALSLEGDVYKSPATYIKGNLGANLDGIYVQNGKEIGIEIKTTSMREKWIEPPVGYYLQMQHYMLVCGLDMFILFAKGPNWQETYFVNKSPETQKAIIQASNEFWPFVEKKEPPYTPSLKNKLEAPYVQASASAGLYTKRLTDQQFKELCEEYIKAKKRASEANNQVESLKTAIFASMGDFRIADNISADTKEFEREVFDSASFKEKYPDIFKQFVKKTTCKQLRVDYA